MTETMPKALALDETEADVFTRSRLKRDRQAAMARFMRDRDVEELQATMTRLDAEERQAKEWGSGEVTPERACHYLATYRSSGQTPSQRDNAPSRRPLSTASKRWDLDLVIHPSAEAERHSLAEGFGSEPLVCSFGRYGRGERI